MKLFGNLFVKKDYATLPKLTKLMTKELTRRGYDIRRDTDSSFILSSDRADLMTVSFKMYKRSFDLWLTDAYGTMVMPVQSYHGNNWRDYMKRQMKNIIHALDTTWVDDGHIINSQWNKMLQEIAYPDIPDGWEGIIITPALKDVMSK